MDTVVEALMRERDDMKPFADHWKNVFLKALAAAPILAVAAKIAGVSPRQATEERYTDGAFARRWDEAVEHGIDEVEAAAYLSAVHGDRKPVFHRASRSVGKWITRTRCDRCS